jgi:hypothetical protein
MNEDKTDYNLSEHTHEMLQQIIRCFPFPSPRNSPRPTHKKSIVRTISNDPDILNQDLTVNPTINDTDTSTTPFSASLNNQSAWQLRKKQLGHLLHRVTSHEAPEGNLGTSSSAATLFSECKGDKRGVLGKLCKVGFLNN